MPIILGAIGATKKAKWVSISYILFNVFSTLMTTIAIILTSILCTAAYYRVFREEVMDDLKVYTKLLADADFL